MTKQPINFPTTTSSLAFNSSNYYLYTANIKSHLILLIITNIHEEFSTLVVLNYIISQQIIISKESFVMFGYYQVIFSPLDSIINAINVIEIAAVYLRH